MTPNRAWLLLPLLLALTACDTVDASLPDWVGGAPRTIKRAEGERIDVLFHQSALTADSEAASTPVDVPEQTNQPQWHSRNQAMELGHLGITGITHEETTTVGNGNDFAYAFAASPMIEDGYVIVMDAAGVISAHDESHISNTEWVNRDDVNEDDESIIGGGLAYAEGTVYASLGNGKLRALSLATGTKKWAASVGAPVHGAPAIGAGIVAVITADNQTIALDAQTGATRWSHRGIREAASFFSTASPAIRDGLVVVTYSSGEIVVLRAETGSVVWSDMLGNTSKTSAAAAFSGISADPIVQDGVVVAVSASGEMQTSALTNGRPLWQKRIGAYAMPWSAGNSLFVLADTHDVAAVFKNSGQIRWATSLRETDTRDPTRDTTPTLFGPIVAGNAVLVLSAEGTLTALKPQDGARINRYELARHAVTAPIIANGALYYITRDATLHKYY